MEPASAYTSRRKTARESTAGHLNQSSGGKPDIRKNNNVETDSFPIRQLAKAAKDSKNGKTEDPTGDDIIITVDDVTVDDATTDDTEEPSCGMGGMNTCTTTVAGLDNSMRLLKREGEKVCVLWIYVVFISTFLTLWFVFNVTKTCRYHFRDSYSSLWEESRGPWRRDPQAWKECYLGRRVSQEKSCS